jgi:hypothetical protein
MRLAMTEVVSGHALAVIATKAYAGLIFIFLGFCKKFEK